MNKTEKIICLVLGAVLAWYLFSTASAAKKTAAARAQVVVKEDVELPAAPALASVTNEVKAATPSYPKASSLPEKTVKVANDLVEFEFSSKGAVVKRAIMKAYARNRGAISTDNPAVVLDYSSAPLGRLSGLAALHPDDDYEIREVTSNSVVFVNKVVTRKYTLGTDYCLALDEDFHQGHNEDAITYLSIGSMAMGNSKNDILSVDSMAFDFAKNEDIGVIHHCEGDSPLKPYLVGGAAGGCSRSASAEKLPESVAIDGAQRYVALKNRFFTTALVASDQPNGGFDVQLQRDMASLSYRPQAVAAQVKFGGVAESRHTVFYAGPKRQALLWDLGMRDVMEFGMWRYLCYPLVSILNFFNRWVPGYGIAIILLTLLVRILFWPLTHKSTVGMKRMQELQPKMKVLQAEFKDNPQRLQQETWALYRQEKVNPMSSCLPMLIQIPVFIALFNVLRSAVELRYAPFLWIGDLSEPEALFAEWFPFGGLNILPILMAATTALQSAFTPSSGDAKQQRMMMVFMPVMMLVMFYSFPSALSLYWFVSNLLSIVQMALIRRAARQPEAVSVEVIDPPVTRQMKRHS